MREQVTKMDLETAFKALDEIDIPKVGKVKANRPNLQEDTKRVDRLSMLVEDYYNLSNQNDLLEAQDAINQDIAQAKLDRIEKIVDLNAKSADELQPSYVGKVVIQCPNCLTMFYKDSDDIEKSDENEDIVNVAEVCQHCGNDSGYTLIGKIADATNEVPDNAEEETVPEDQSAPATEEDEKENSEEENTTEEEPDLDVGDLNLSNSSETDNSESSESETSAQESFNQHEGSALTEDTDIDAQKTEDSELTEDARAALDTFIRNLGPNTNTIDDQFGTESVDDSRLVQTEDLATKEKLDDYIDNLPEDLHEADDETFRLDGSKKDVSDAEFRAMLNNPLYYESLNDDEKTEVETPVNAEEIDDASLNEIFTNFLTEVYSNVDNFSLSNCKLKEDKLMLEGLINFKSGRNKNIILEFKTNNNKLISTNNTVIENMSLKCDYKINNKKLILEKLNYEVRVDNNLVEGLISR